MDRVWLVVLFPSLPGSAIGRVLCEGTGLRRREPGVPRTRDTLPVGFLY